MLAFLVFDVDPYSMEVVRLYPTDEYHPSICSFQVINTIFFSLGVQSQISEVSALFIHQCTFIIINVLPSYKIVKSLKSERIEIQQAVIDLQQKQLSQVQDAVKFSVKDSVKIEISSWSDIVKKNMQVSQCNSICSHCPKSCPISSRRKFSQ